MDLKDVLAALEKVENGAEMAAVINAEINRLSGESKGYRVKSRDASEKVKTFLKHSAWMMVMMWSNRRKA